MGFCFLNSFAYLQEKDSLITQEYYYSTGEISSKGIIKNGQPWGAWRNYYTTGILKSEGEKINGKSESTWIFYDEKGQREKSITYQQNLKNGPYILYDSLGLISLESFYRNDTLDGVMKTYVKGKLKSEKIYESGKAEKTEKIFDPADGRLLETIQYDKGEVIASQTVNRYDKSNKKTGLWRTYYPDGRIRSECYYENDVPVRSCTEWNEKGQEAGTEAPVAGRDFPEIKQRFYPNGQLAESGAFKNGYKQGVFNEYDSTGVWQGSFLYETDTLRARGFVLPSGRYDSSWVFYYPTQKIASKGKYTEGSKSGAWTFYYPTGKKEQEGYFRKGLVDGDWTWYFPNGQIRRTETYNRGLLNGVQVEYDSLGNRLTEITYDANIITGAWYYHINDHTEKGLYEMGLKTGPWKYYYLDRTLMFKGSFKDDVPVGKHVFYYPSGSKQAIRKYKGGVKQGIWREFDERGNLEHIFTYKNNVMISADGEKIRKKNRE